MDDELSRAADVVRAARSVVVLTGAGVSAESGVPTFRASDGLWEGHRIEDVATPTGFQRDPELVWKFYNARRANVATVQPNPGHCALVELEEFIGENFTLVTQNVDGLHLQAGSKNVLEIHGSLRETRCLGCGAIAHRGLEVLAERPICPVCGGWLRPNIVWFHEMLPPEIWERSATAASECDVLLVVGTSAVVYPAASLIPIANRSTIIECNLTPTAASDLADFGLYGPSGEVLPRLMEKVLG